jgi:hypothetical protein
MSYRDTHDHLGNPRRADFRISDLIICSMAFAVIAALFSGVLV